MLIQFLVPVSTSWKSKYFVSGNLNMCHLGVTDESNEDKTDA